MEKHAQTASDLRSSQIVPNCSETILMAYAKELGISKEQAAAFGANFGGGMKTGSVCGAVTAAILVLGGLGITDGGTVAQFQNRMKENHNGHLDCESLLKANAQAGGKKKPHCDGMILEAIELIEHFRGNKN